MKLPVCSICQCSYNEGERVPLMLQCGHSYCKDCLVNMFAASTDHALVCPRCRQPTKVGNSVEALHKNFGMLALIRRAPSECQSDTDDDDEEDANRGEDAGVPLPRSPGCWPPAPNCAGIPLDLGSHVMRLGKLLGTGPRPGQDVWTATLSGPHGCRHKVAVKRIDVSAGMNLAWVRSKLEDLHRAATWCQNVCTVHGACEKDGKLCIVMDRYQSSVQAVMQQNEGRLTLEQILRYGADISRGVAELQAAGVVCMNLKPSNFLLDNKDRVVVADYGIPEVLKRPNCAKAAARTGEERLRSAREREHFCIDCAMLNPCYMAPEAWEPLRKSTINLFWEDAIGISSESDVWSFGCALIEMCTGSKPWSGCTQDDIYKAVVKAKRLPPQYVGVVGGGIPPELWKMIGECLSFKPSKRPVFHDMLALFLRHLKDMPLSPPASPDNDPTKDSELRNGPSPSSTFVFTETTHCHLRLHQLIAEGDVDGVRDLLRNACTQSGVSIQSLLESHNSDGQTALHLAAMRSDASILEILCSFPEVEVEILDKDGDTPIVCPIASGSLEVLKLLIRKGANVNARLQEGLGPTLVQVCALYGQADCLRELLIAGADPNVTNDEGDTALHQAIERRNTDCATVILEIGGCMSMRICNLQNFTPLHMCVRTANVELVKKWAEIASTDEIADVIDMPSPMGTALYMSTRLKRAQQKESRELVRILLGLGANGALVDPLQGQTPLHVAASLDDAQMVKVILDAGVDVNVRNVHNATPLHVALAKGSKACVRLLLDRGANCNLQDDEGHTAFHIAGEMAKMVRENLDWIVIMLKRHDAATDIRNHSCKTLRDLLEALPREWISEDLMDALAGKGISLSPTVYEVGDWVKFRRTVTTPTHGWGGAKPWSVGFVQSIVSESSLVVSFCSGEVRALVDEVVKVIPLDRGQYVRLKPTVKQPRFGWRGQSRDSIGTVLCVDDDGILRVGFPGASRGWKADPAEMERVEEFKVGDWVRIRPSLTSAKHGLGSVSPGSIGVVHSIRPDNSLLLDFSYQKIPLRCEPEEVERVEPFKVGDRVCVKRSVAEPKYGWCGETHHSVGEITEVGTDGLLVIYVVGRSATWQADPSDMEKVEDLKVGDWVRVKACVCSPKYGWDDVSRTSVGVVFYVDLDEGDVGIGFCHRTKPFPCSVTDVEKVTPFEVGQEVHIAPTVTAPRLGWSGENSASRGRIWRIDMDGTLNVKVANRSTLWKLAPGDTERLSGFEVGDWVRLKPQPGGLKPSYDWHGSSKESVAVVHSTADSGYLELAGCFRTGRWLAHYSEVDKAVPLRVGQHVRFRAGLSEPRWGWRGCTPDSRGVVIGVHADGELRLAFPGLRPPWRGDPADFDREEMFEVGDWVKVKEDVGTPRFGWKGARPGSLGIVQGVGCEEEERAVLVGICGEQERWVGLPSEVDRVAGYRVGQRVRVRADVAAPRFGWCGHDHASVAAVAAVDADGRLRAHSQVSPWLREGNQRSWSWLLDPADVEAVAEEALKVGDWVRVKASVPVPSHQWGEVNHRSVGVVHKVDDDGGAAGGGVDGDASLRVKFCRLERLWVCKAAEMERVEPLRVGDRVRLVGAAGGGGAGGAVNAGAGGRTGVVHGVDADGKVRVKFAGRCEGRLWVGDPADVELDSSTVEEQQQQQQRGESAKEEDEEDSKLLHCT